MIKKKANFTLQEGVSYENSKNEKENFKTNHINDSSITSIKGS